jgi:large subunit ribosomal protein L31
MAGPAHPHASRPDAQRARRQWVREELQDMKEGIHPPYHPVVFKDASTGAIILTRSTMTSEQKIRLDDGNEYPLILLEITADSHPFYTGTQRLIDTQGRVDKFKKRYGRA